MAPTTDNRERLRKTGSGWASGACRAAPIAAGYVPIGFSYGALAVDAGLSPSVTFLMSLVVYAGASQFVAVSLLAAGVPALSVVLSVFVVNIRHLIMTSALAPYLAGWRRLELAAFAFQVTDETFVVHATEFASGRVSKRSSYATNVCAQASWLAGTALGVVAGRKLGDLSRYGLDFALPALFVALLALQIRNWVHVAVAALAMVLTWALGALGIGHWTAPTAAVMAAGLGVLVYQARCAGKQPGCASTKTQDRDE